MKTPWPILNRSSFQNVILVASLETTQSQDACCGPCLYKRHKYLPSNTSPPACCLTFCKWLWGNWAKQGAWPWQSTAEETKYAVRWRRNDMPSIRMSGCMRQSPILGETADWDIYVRACEQIFMTARFTADVKAFDDVFSPKHQPDDYLVLSFFNSFWLQAES